VARGTVKSGRHMLVDEKTMTCAWCSRRGRRLGGRVCQRTGSEAAHYRKRKESGSLHYRASTLLLARYTQPCG